MDTTNPERVLVHAPYGRDGAIICSVLEKAGIKAEVCSTIEGVCQAVQRGAGAIIIADEALRTSSVEMLKCLFGEQDSWSDLPIIVLTGTGEATAMSRYRLKLVEPLGNVTLLERPLRTETLTSAVYTALRARRRQYEIRNLLEKERRALEALKESEDHYRHTVDLNPQVPWTARADGSIEDVAPRWLEMTGLTKEEALGEGWVRVRHPDDRDRMCAGWMESVRTGEPFDSEHRVLCADSTYCWVRSRAWPRRDAEGNIIRWYGATEDINDRKNAEEQLKGVNSQLTANNRELQEFAYVSSHDLQEPLRTVNIYTEMLMRKLADSLDSDTRKYADFVKNGVTRMEQLLKDLLQFSRTAHEAADPTKPADVGAALSQALSILQQRIDETGATVTYSEMPIIRGDQAQLVQVFQNLISNSIKYRRTEEPLQVSITAKKEDQQWLISVRDNGIGFDQQHADRIFGLFKRLHRDQYPGTGLGLAICKRIVERHGGRIWAEGQPNEGATFYFTLNEGGGVVASQ